jgi:hypothetical protein
MNVMVLTGEIHWFLKVYLKYIVGDTHLGSAFQYAWHVSRKQLAGLVLSSLPLESRKGVVVFPFNIRIRGEMEKG